MNITVLGCGSSGGVPLIGNNWGDCNPHNPRNRRTRVSILVEHADTILMIDTTPDMREQLLTCNLQKLDAILFTHAHADHCHGIDELRSINWLMRKPIDIYAEIETLTELKARFAYIFGQDTKTKNYYKPAIVEHEIAGLFTVGDIEVIPFVQNHGHINSLGFRFGDFAYSTDVHAFDETAWTTLKGIKTWIIDCVRTEPHPTHSHLAQTLEWIEKLKPERSYLTHMNHTMDYDTLKSSLPKGVEPAYDGLVIEC
jgi:phosphoribosyl 1,2-cyclic phosphate phosphodiesterase